MFLNKDKITHICDPLMNTDHEHIQLLDSNQKIEQTNRDIHIVVKNMLKNYGKNNIAFVIKNKDKVKNTIIDGKKIDYFPEDERGIESFIDKFTQYIYQQLHEGYKYDCIGIVYSNESSIEKTKSCFYLIDNQLFLQTDSKNFIQELRSKTENQLISRFPQKIHNIEDTLKKFSGTLPYIIGRIYNEFLEYKSKFNNKN